jgi:hypothetical protein
MASPSASTLRNLKKQGKAMAPAKPGGKPRFYIRNGEDLDNAIKAVGRGGGSHDAIRAYIIRRAKALGLSSRIPANWTSSGSNTGSK